MKFVLVLLILWGVCSAQLSFSYDGSIFASTQSPEGQVSSVVTDPAGEYVYMATSKVQPTFNHLIKVRTSDWSVVISVNPPTPVFNLLFVGNSMYGGDYSTFYQYDIETLKPVANTSFSDFYTPTSTSSDGNWIYGVAGLKNTNDYYIIRINPQTLEIDSNNVISSDAGVGQSFINNGTLYIGGVQGTNTLSSVILSDFTKIAKTVNIPLAFGKLRNFNNVVGVYNGIIFIADSQYGGAATCDINLNICYSSADSFISSGVITQDGPVMGSRGSIFYPVDYVLSDLGYTYGWKQIPMASMPAWPTVFTLPNTNKNTVYWIDYDSTAGISYSVYSTVLQTNISASNLVTKTIISTNTLFDFQRGASSGSAITFVGEQAFAVFSSKVAITYNTTNSTANIPESPANSQVDLPGSGIDVAVFGDYQYYLFSYQFMATNYYGVYVCGPQGCNTIKLSQSFIPIKIRAINNNMILVSGGQNTSVVYVPAIAKIDSTGAVQYISFNSSQLMGNTYATTFTAFTSDKNGTFIYAGTDQGPLKKIQIVAIDVSTFQVVQQYLSAPGLNQVVGIDINYDGSKVYAAIYSGTTYSVVVSLPVTTFIGTVTTLDSMEYIYDMDYDPSYDMLVVVGAFGSDRKALLLQMSGSQATAYVILTGYNNPTAVAILPYSGVCYILTNNVYLSFARFGGVPLVSTGTTSSSSSIAATSSSTTASATTSAASTSAVTTSSLASTSASSTSAIAASTSSTASVASSTTAAAASSSTSAAAASAATSTAAAASASSTSTAAGVTSASSASTGESSWVKKHSLQLGLGIGLGGGFALIATGALVLIYIRRRRPYLAVNST